MFHSICGCVRVFTDILVCTDACMYTRETTGQPRVSLLRCCPTVVRASGSVASMDLSRYVRPTGCPRSLMTLLPLPPQL